MGKSDFFKLPVSLMNAEVNTCPDQLQKTKSQNVVKHRNSRLPNLGLSKCSAIMALWQSKRHLGPMYLF